MTKDWLYHGMVAHNRIRPVRNAFRYPALFICFPLHRKAELASRLFSLEHFNLFSFHEADHGDGIDGQEWIQGVLAREGVASADGEVWLQTMPRMLGFVFNPVSFWYCHDSDGGLRAVLCEVNNTFGERHCYLLTAANDAVISTQTVLITRKVFHVSPFLEIRGHYRFRFRQRHGARTVSIDYFEDSAPLLKTMISGRPAPLNDKTLLQAALSRGWVSATVVLRIHWQALRLWIKGARFIHKPAPPTEETSR